MEKEIPKIEFARDKTLEIEVMNFDQLYTKLNEIENHNPFTVHKIQFYMILVVTAKIGHSIPPSPD